MIISIRNNAVYNELGDEVGKVTFVKEDYVFVPSRILNSGGVEVEISTERLVLNIDCVMFKSVTRKEPFKISSTPNRRVDIEL